MVNEKNKHVCIIAAYNYDFGGFSVQLGDVLCMEKEPGVYFFRTALQFVNLVSLNLSMFSCVNEATLSNGIVNRMSLQQ